MRTRDMVMTCRHSSRIMHLLECVFIFEHCCGPAFFHVRPYSMARLAFCCVIGKPFKKKRFRVATYFCFILKGKNKIRKKNPKCDS